MCVGRSGGRLAGPGRAALTLAPPLRFPESPPAACRLNSLLHQLGVSLGGWKRQEEAQRGACRLPGVDVCGEEEGPLVVPAAHPSLHFDLFYFKLSAVSLLGKGEDNGEGTGVGCVE